MQINLTAGQCESLSDSLQAFNQLTGKRWSLSRFVQFVIADAIAQQEESARITRAIFGKSQTAGVRHVH